jgi:hypothetical protein
MSSTGYGDGTHTYYQSSSAFAGYTGGWASYLISNHGNGATYYNQTLILPFWGAPQYSRLEGGTSKGPYTFLTTENYTSYSPSLTGSGASGSWGISVTGTAGGLSGSPTINVTDVYAGSWLRNNNSNTGLYNQANGNHFYSRGGNRWGITGNGTSSNIYLDFFGNHETTIRGSIHADTSSNIGFLTPGGAWSFMVDSSGNATATLNVTAYSDERKKKNWRPVADNFVELLAEVKSGVYERIDFDVSQVGVSAQSLQKLLPEAVVEDGEGFLAVAYGNAALASSVELAKELVALKELVKELNRKIDILMNK